MLVILVIIFSQISDKKYICFFLCLFFFTIKHTLNEFKTVVVKDNGIAL